MFRRLATFAAVGVFAAGLAAGCTTTSQASSSGTTAGSAGPPTSVLSSSSNHTHPPADDVTLKGCAVDPDLGTPSATGVIVNHSSKPSDYDIEVGFYQGSVRVDTGYDLENNVSPGETVNMSAGGTTQVSGAVTCKVISVDRMASAG